MCGRFSIVTTGDELIKRFGANVFDKDFLPRYNAAPSQKLPIILNTDPLKIHMSFWGFIPHWVKSPTWSDAIINARAETICEKSAFKAAFESQRCLVLADSFYEWKKYARVKIPYRILLRDAKPFAFAGIWERVNGNSEIGDIAFAIITTNVNEFLASIHNRMPVILQRDVEKKWIDQDTPVPDLLKMLVPYPADDMKMYPISRMINSPAKDSPEVIQQKGTALFHV